MKTIKYDQILSGMLLIYMMAEIFGVSSTGIAFVWNAGLMKLKADSWFLLTIPVGILCVKKCLDGERSVTCLTAASLWGLAALIHVAVLCRRLIYFVTHRDAWEYTDQALKHVLSCSVMMGTGMAEEDMKYLIPDCNTTLLLSHIMAGRGILIGIVASTMITGILLRLLYQGWKREGEDRILILGSSLVMTVMLLINVLVNFRVIPFGIIPSFLPLMTYNTGDGMISLIMILIPIALLIRPKEKHAAPFA